MKYVDEFRDPDAAKALLTRIHDDAEKLGRSISLMEVCGGHTHTIYRYGLENLLPSSIELVHGPGCPVCVLPMGRVDDALWLAQQPNVILTCFGDMMRVPGSTESLMQARARHLSGRPASHQHALRTGGVHRRSARKRARRRTDGGSGHRLEGR